MRVVLVVVVLLSAIGMYSGWVIMSELRVATDASLLSRLEALPFAAD